MALTDFFYFENPGFVALVFGLLVFIALTTALRRFVHIDAGVSALLAFAIAGIATWKLYTEGFYGATPIFVFLYAAIILIILILILRALFKGFRRGFSYFFA